MRYLSLDQSLKCTGWAIFDNNTPIKIGVIKTKPTDPIEKRLNSIFSQIDLLEDEYNFDYVFFEDTQKQQNLETYKRLCYVQATIMLWCAWNNINYTVLPPSHWRKILKENYLITFGRKREEQKKAAVEWTKNFFPAFQEISEDEADALCIGQAGILELGHNESAF